MNWSELLESILASVLKASWHGSILVVLVFAIQFLAKSKLPPAWRHALWCLVLLRFLMPMTPQSAISMFNLAPTADVTALVSTRKSAEDRLEVLARASQAQGAAAENSAHPAAQSRIDMESVLGAWTVRRVAAFGWLTGASLLAIHLVLANLLFARQLRRSVQITDPKILGLFDECKKSVGVTRPVQLLETRSVDAPALWGMLKPKLLIPAGFLGMFSKRELRFIFVHECAHLRRHDLALNWLGLSVQLLHWFNPVVWLCLRRMRTDREIACDALVLSTFGEQQSREYGQTLIEVMKGFSRPATLPGLVGILEDNEQIKTRIANIVEFKRPTHWPWIGAALVFAFAAAALTDAQTERKASDSAKSNPASTEAIIREVEKRGGKITFHETKPGRPIAGIDFSSDYSGQRPKLPSQRPELPKVTDAFLQQISHFTELESLNLSRTDVGDDGMKYVARLLELKTLNLLGTKVSGVGLAHLKPLSGLKELNLLNTRVTGADLIHLAHFPQLRSLNVQNLKVTDAGLQHLKPLKELNDLILQKTYITSAGLSALSGAFGL